MKAKRLTINDFINIMDENKNITVFDCTGKEIRAYNGKDSIDTRYMNDRINTITVNNDTLMVYLEKEVR